MALVNGLSRPRRPQRLPKSVWEAIVNLKPSIIISDGFMGMHGGLLPSPGDIGYDKLLMGVLFHEWGHKGSGGGLSPFGKYLCAIIRF
jgi:hypothetical protein